MYCKRCLIYQNNKTDRGYRLQKKTNLCLPSGWRKTDLKPECPLLNKSFLRLSCNDGEQIHDLVTECLRARTTTICRENLSLKFPLSFSKETTTMSFFQSKHSVCREAGRLTARRTTTTDP